MKVEWNKGERGKGGEEDGMSIRIMRW